MGHKRYFLSFWAVLLLFLLAVVPLVHAERLVRVGWYNYPPLSSYNPEKLPAGSTTAEDVPGVYGGYNYEYLRMISQTNGWHLQFVYGTITEALDRLQKGEVDIVGGIGKTPAREENFAFPINSALRTSIGLIARGDDPRFTMNDFAHFNGMRVGAVTGTNPLFHIQQWSAQRQLQLTFVYFSTFPAMYAALDDGTVDAVADSLIAPRPNYKILASMEAQGIYFIGNKNNTQLMQELDDAITQIQYLKPGYQESLAAKYLYSQSYSSFTLNRREQEYLDKLLASGKPLRVSFAPGWFPIEYFDASNGAVHGIMADIFQRISQLTGLQFEYVRETDLADPADQVDIIATMNTDFAWGDQHNAYLTQSVFDVPIFMVSLPDSQKFDVVAVRQDAHLTKSVKERLAQEGDDVQYLEVSRASDCMEALLDGRAGRTYVNAYELNYYMNQNKFSHLKLQPVPGFSESSSIGISKNADPLLCSILCQALRSISPAEMNSIILKNTTFSPNRGLLDFIYAYPLGSLAAVALLFLLLGGTIFFYYSNRKSERLRMQLRDTLNSRMSLLQANKELSHLSQYDSLTGIPNRRGLDEFIDRVYADSEQLTLVMMDIDEFKKFNDTYGHLAGDKALSATAKILEHNALVTGGFTARYGGEEFIWIDTLHVRKAALDILKNVQRDLAQENIPHEATKAGRLTLSMGYAEKRPDETLDDLIRRADTALYAAKHGGRNQIVQAETTD